MIAVKKENKNCELKLYKSYQYVEINGEGARRRFFCLQQNPLFFAWLLFFKKDVLNPIFRSNSKNLLIRLLMKLKYNIRLSKIKLRTIIYIVQYKLKLRRIDSIIELPFYGQLCVPVHEGYKIFNFHRGVVIKKFDLDIKEHTFLSEIKRLQNISQIGFAPSIKKWNVKERWYEEEYISGCLDTSYLPQDSKSLLKKFYQTIVPCLDSLMFFQKPMTKNVSKYINEIVRTFEDSRLSKIDRIKSFFYSIVERLHGRGDLPVYLVFTHGDFCPENILNTKEGIKFLDWESACYRSVLFDFYSYFFYRSASKKLLINKLIAEIKEALPFIISRLALKAPDISKDLLSLEEVYRWLFYIEQVCLLTEREKTDTNLNIMEDILNHIEVFDRYEYELYNDQ